MQRDYYKLLGVTRSATADEIKLAYRRLAQRLHPDVSANPQDSERFKEITVAYHVLRDAERRVRYDIEAMEADLDASERELKAAKEILANGYAAAAAATSVPPAAPHPAASWERGFGEHDATAPGEPEGILRRLARRRADRTAPEGYRVPGDDYEVVGEVTFEEAVRGGTVTLTFAVPERTDSGGTREAERTVEVRLPKNAYVGQRLRLKGKGGPGENGGPDGDLHVEIAYRRHRLFRVSSYDIWFYLPIAPWEAVLGAVVEIPTLDKPFRVRVPAGATSGQTFRLPGRGLPKSDGSRGDLLACLRVITPEHPTEAEKQLYLQLARQSRFNARRGFG
ncbi:MAG: DnaJ C-terminal domain-containing protein [Burkholderiales bacterium]